MQTILARPLALLALGGMSLFGTARIGNAQRATANPSATASARAVNALADQYVREFYSAFPEAAVFADTRLADGGALEDNSAAAIARWQSEEDAMLAKLATIDAASLAGRPEWATLGTLREQLVASKNARVCRLELWSVSPAPNGWMATLTEVADVQPVGSDSARRNAIRRIRATSKYLDNEIVNLRAGLEAGYTAPAVLVRGVISQINDMLEDAPGSSPFAAAAQRDSTPGFRAQLGAAVSGDVYPAMRRYLGFLQREYLPRARTTIAVSALPNGFACYRASARLSSSLDIAPDSVHRLGLAQIARLEREMRDIAQRDFKTSDVPALLRRLRTDTAYTFHTRQEIRDTARAAIARAQKAMPRWFGILPKAGDVVRDYPEFRQIAGAIGEANPGVDGKPATFLINTYDPTHKPRASFEALAFHEGVPGHGLQLTIATELKDAHPMSRYFFSSGYVEGWALYAEGLAEEMGLYSSSMGKLGLRASQSARAARLVVDPAIHTMGWTREQAVAYMKAHTTWDDRLIEAEVDRYIAWPGQATSYMLGQMTILALRQQAKDALGPKFDIRAFHDQVLGSGNLTLPQLREKIQLWTQSGSSRAK